MAGCIEQLRKPDLSRSEISYFSGGLPRFSQRCRLTAGVALQQLGVPYGYGGASTSRFDCSGLVQYSYRAAAKNLPRTIGQLWSATHTIDRKDMQKGDLLLFSIEGKMSHVGMYLGGECFVHAPSSGRTGSNAKLNFPFYTTAFFRAGRPQ